ncbi:MAG TPA: hemolysin III family protein [Thermoanaerobaculia bacterium]|nr:hemolysin III family protein [Thermoanaerobaculia bacterium]
MARRPLTQQEERACSISHGIGLAASLVALPVLVLTALERQDNWQVVGGAIYGTMLILLYAASTLYHACPPHKNKALWRRLDHAAIYLLIAGTYTPFTLGALRGPWGWSLLVTIWVLAVGGILFKTFLGFRYPKTSAAFYLAMGWLVLIALDPLTTHVDPGGVAWLVAGGVSYTAGVLFFAWHRLQYAHLVWHLFVMVGSVCHFFAVLFYAH